jgi:hypothetical protein
MGVVIGHHKTPLAFQNEVVRELLASAKARAKAQPAQPVSAIDIAVLDSFESYAGGLHEFRERALRRRVRSGTGVVRLTGRPFSLPQSEGLRRTVCALARTASGQHRAQLHLLADALSGETDPDEVDLFLQYQLARADKDWRAALSRVLRSVAQVFGAPAGTETSPSLFVAGGASSGRFESPWLDVLELLDFSAGGEES